MDNCPVCGTECIRTNQSLDEKFFECPTCGRVEFVGLTYDTDIGNPDDYDKLASYLYYNGKLNPPINDYRFFNIIALKTRFDKIHSEYPWCFHVTKEIVDNWYPKTFSEKVDLFLLGLASRANYMGETILFSEAQLQSACFVLRKPSGPWSKKPNIVNEQVQYFIKCLVEQEYIEAGSCRCILLPKGYERIDSLQKNIAQNTKNVFIAMSFAPEMVNVRDAIKTALLECGFIPRIMDEIEHNHQIVPEMLYEIREARFIIAELTGHNNGAYFEAGYALGLGKEVIQVCQKSKFGDDGHFDVKQINSVLWEDTDDLTRKLISRIKAAIA
jgi:nucleoside 2-deoxyribosyltransferase